MELKGNGDVRILVTGGAGFIGSALCRYLVGELGDQVLNIDKLTYAANPASLEPIARRATYEFRKADICDRRSMDEAFETLRRASQSLNVKLARVAQTLVENRSRL